MRTPFENAVEGLYRNLTGMLGETTPLFCWAFSKAEWIGGNVHLPSEVCARIRMFLPPSSYKQLPVTETFMGGLIKSYSINANQTLTIKPNQLVEFASAQNGREMVLLFELDKRCATGSLILCRVSNVDALTSIGCKFVFAEAEYSLPGSAFDASMNDGFMAAMSGSITSGRSEMWVNVIPQRLGQHKMFSVSVTLLLACVLRSNCFFAIYSDAI